MERDEVGVGLGLGREKILHFPKRMSSLPCYLGFKALKLHLIRETKNKIDLSSISKI